MASRTLSFSSLASAFAPFPARSRPRHPPLRLLGLHLSSGHLLRASTLSTAAAPAPDADADADPYEGVDTVEHLLAPKPTSPGGGRMGRLMKMQRRADADGPAAGRGRWFPYLDAFRGAGGVEVTSQEVVDVLEPYILEPRRDRIRRAVQSRSYAVCLVVEGLTDFGNVSAAFRSADALGVQSVHVISCEDNKRFLCMTWIGLIQRLSLWAMRLCRGISNVALKLSDMHCSVPMKGMVDSFNVSVAAGILMHHAVYDRVSRLGQNGDLTSEENRILLAEFYLRHRESTATVIHEYAKRKANNLVAKL
ncbi:hypothetical protein ACQJBY_014999 [Aegilops geniculata]